MTDSELNNRFEVLAFCVAMQEFPSSKATLTKALTNLAATRPELAEAVTTQLKLLTEARSRQEQDGLSGVPIGY